MLDLQLRNRDFFGRVEPGKEHDFFTLEVQRARIVDPSRRHSWLIVDEGEPAGVVSLSHIARGPLQSANLGYSVDQARNGRGLATRAVGEVVEIAFGELELHRLEAGTLPDNLASQRVLEKNGFERFGYAKQYLLINGEWRDHVLYERIAG